MRVAQSAGYLLYYSARDYCTLYFDVTKGHSQSK